MTYPDLTAHHESRRADAAERKLKNLHDTLSSYDRRLAALESRSVGVTQRSVDKQFQGLIRELAPEIKNLRRRLDNAMTFRGLFQRADHYQRGDVTSCDGSLWFCIRDTDGADGKPGSDAGASGWQMMTKSR